MSEEQGDWKVYKENKIEEGLKEADKILTPIILNEEQKKIILETWDKTDFISLVKLVFKTEGLDGRSKEAKLVQKFLSERKLKKKNQPKEILILNESQKEYIRNSIQTLTPHEIGKIIFDNSKLDPSSEEIKIINTYAETLKNDGVEQFPHEDYPNGEYKPPDQLSAVVTKVNKYLRKDLSLKTMPMIQKKSMESVRNFIHAPRFLQTINSYISAKSREMFEGEFVRTVFDKPDLTPDELNVAITLCQHYVMGVTLHRHLDMLNTKYEEVLNDPDGKMTQAFAEMIKAKSTELKECNKAQTELTKFLSGERSKRQDKQGSSNISMAKLVEWFRNDEERTQALKRAELQAQEDEAEVKRLEEVSETKARVMGISKSELLYG